MSIEEFSWNPSNSTAIEAATILKDELLGPNIPVDENLLFNLEETCVNQRNFVLRKGLFVVATGGLSIQRVDSGLFFLENIGVRNDYQRQGIGKTLIGELEDIAYDICRTRTIMGVQPTDTLQAVNFYLNLGYRPKDSKSNPMNSTLFKIIE